jgi:transposase InsO family protein
MTQQQLIANNRRNLLIFAQRHTIAQACRVFGISRTTFYEIKKHFLSTGSLEPCVRRKPRMPNATKLNTKKELLKLVQQYPGRGTPFYAYSLRNSGINITPQAIWICLKRFGLNNRYKRLVYIEDLNVRNHPLTERTLKTLHRKFLPMTHGYWPGHVVALDTFYVGNIKGVGRIYQMTGIDLCSRYGWARLYTSKSAQSSLHFVEKCLIPQFFANEVSIESVLSDNGTEFTNHRFRQMLADYGITQKRIPPGKPMFNGYCERFQRIILEEFYQPVFRKKFFHSTEDLQTDLTKYLTYYNFERAHFGVIKTGGIPAEILKSKTAILKQRFSKLLT